MLLQCSKELKQKKLIQFLMNVLNCTSWQFYGTKSSNALGLKSVKNNLFLFCCTVAWIWKTSYFFFFVLLLLPQNILSCDAELQRTLAGWDSWKGLWFFTYFELDAREKYWQDVVKRSEQQKTSLATSEKSESFSKILEQHSLNIRHFPKHWLSPFSLATPSPSDFRLLKTLRRES